MQIRSFAHSLCLVVSSLLITSLQTMATDVSGTIASDTTWDTAGSPWVIIGNVTVPAGVTLTIDPGVIVTVNRYHELVVQGTLNANGVNGNPVLFSGSDPSAGWWAGIRIADTGSATLEYCELSHGGYYNGGTVYKTGSGSLSISNCTIRDSSTAGLRILSGFSSLLSENNTFENNANGVQLGLNVSFSDTTSTFSGNTSAQVIADGGTHTENVSWQLSSGSAITLTSNHTVQEGATLTVNPGTIVKLVRYAGLVVDGQLIAEGTQGEPIHFTSSEDDSVGGDSNNNGDATTGSPDWWASIHVRNNGSATLNYCRITYGGYYNASAVYKLGTGSLSIRNSILRLNNGAGLRLISGFSSFVTENNTFEENTHGVRLGLDTSFSDTTSTFTNNTAAQVLADSGTHTTDVTWELSPAYSILVTGNHTVAAGNKLTLQPGLILKFGRYAGLYIDGTLEAMGSVAQPIHFTSSRDDTIGGDSDNDGGADAPFRDWWASVQVRNTGSAVFENCHFAYAGYYDKAGIYMLGTGALTVTDSSFRETNGAGIRLQNGYSSFTSLDNSFHDNVYGVRLGTSTSFSDTSSTFENNDSAQVLADGGSYTGDVTWELSPDYAITTGGGITITAGSSLTLSKGLILKFPRYQGILVDGTLNAVGTADELIHLTADRDDSVGGDSNNDDANTAPESNWWSSIQVRNAGSAVLEHCHLTYAGYYDNAGVFKLGTGDLSMRHCKLSMINGAGLRLTSGSGNVLSEYNRFQDNTHGIQLGLNTSLSDTTSTFSNNSISQVTADAGTHAEDLTWELSSHYAIYLPGNHTVGASATLTLSPGLVLKFARYAGLIVDGNLVADGTPGSPIQLTEIRDDSVGGDSNNDGGGTNPGPGWWAGIQVRNAGSIDMRYSILRYAGYYTASGILKSGTGPLTMNECTLSMNTGNGLQLFQSTGQTDILRCSFLENATGVLVNGVAESVSLKACLFEMNSGHGVVNSGSTEVDASGNWWGHASGPYHPAGNPDGQGDAVSDGVAYDPWRSTPTSASILSPLRSGTIVAGDTLRFTGAKVDDPTVDYSWDFGDGRTSNILSPGLVTWLETGTFDVEFATVVNGEVDPYPEMRSYEVVADTGSHPDLKVTSISVPSSIGIGQSSTVTYTVKNVGPGNLPSSSWTDRLYLSEDENLDTGDMQLGSTNIQRSLESDSSYDGSIPLTLPPVEDGARHLILSINDEWSVVELQRLNNEQSEQVTVLIPQLQIGETFSGSHPAGRTEQYFRMDAVAGKNLLLEFSHVEPGLEIYVRFGSLPTPTDFDYRLTDGRLAIPAASEGSWYILVHGDVLPQQGEFSLKFDQTDVALTSATPTRHGSNTPLDLVISGAGFSNPSAVELVASNQTTYAADSFVVNDFTTLTASFPGGMLPGDTYAIRVTQSGSAAELPGAIEIIADGEPDFYVDIISPSAMGYHQLATIYVEYGNAGSTSMEAPLLVVTALQNDKPGALMSLDQSGLSEGFWTSATPKGFTNSVRIIAGGDQPGILQPGEHIRVPVYYIGWQTPWDFSYPPFEFKVVALTADDDRPIEWALLKDTLQPPYIDDEPWTAIWQNFTEGIGSEVGDFVSMLSRNAVHLKKLGSDVRDANKLLNYEVVKSKSLHSPYSQLTASIDLRTKPGLIDLWFMRSFPRSITHRFTLGPLGYGWNHFWEITLEKDDDGTIIISHGNGAKRVFQPDSRRNAYFSSKGDNAVLMASGGNYTLEQPGGNQYVFNSNGQLTSVQDRNGNSIQLSYASGKLSRLEHSNGMFINLSYNGEGLLSNIQDSYGDQVLFAYDSGKHLTQVTDRFGRITQYAYSSSTDPREKHALTQIQHFGGRTDNYTYNDQGLLESHNNGLGTTQFSYDQGDITATNAEGHSVTVSINDLGSISKVTGPDNQVTSLTYDDNLNVRSIRSPDGTSFSYESDRNGALKQATNQQGQTTTYQANSFGKITKRSTPALIRTDMDYDNEGNLTQLTQADGQVESFEYDSSGQQIKRVPPSGLIENTTYNNAGKPTAKDYSDGSSRDFVYDSRDRLVSATNENGTTSFEYNSMDQVTKVTYPTGLYVEYEYDSVGRLISSSDHNGLANRYTYNSAGLVETLRDGNNQELLRYEYDSLGRVIEKRYATGTRTTYTLNANGQVTEQKTYDVDDSVLAQYSLEYNSSGQAVSYETPDGDFTYTYDQAGRVAVETFNPVSGPISTTRYTRDADGGLSKVTKDGTEMNFTRDANGNYTHMGDVTANYNANGSIASRSTPDGDFNYTYDAVGNLTGCETDGGTYEVKYDAIGIPISLSTPDRDINYVYDVSGRADLYGEYSSTGDPVRTYQRGLDMAVVNYEDTSYYPEYEPLSGRTDMALPTSGSSPDDYYLPGDSPFSSPFDYGDPLIPSPDFYGHAIDGFMSFGQEVYKQGGQVGEWVARSVEDSQALDLIFNDNTSAVAGLAGLPNSLNTLNKLFKPRVVVTGTPDLVKKSLDFLGKSDGLSYGLGIFGVFSGGLEGLEGVRDTWRQGRSLDGWDILNPFGSVDDGTYKTRHGFANAALAGLGMLVTYMGGAAALPVAGPVAAAAAVGAYISDNTMEWQIAFWGWFDGLKGTDERYEGSSASRSKDPNQKLGINGYGENNYVPADTLLTYRIDFENHPTATAPAQVVTIRDQLPDEVDWTSFELLEAGFGDIVIPIESGRRQFATVVDYAYQDHQYDFEINVHVEISIDNGEIFAIFYSIDPDTELPPPVEIGFLPPEPEKDPDPAVSVPGQGRGQGYISYAVRPREDLLSGTEIRNIATIQFDFSIDIDTNQVNPLDKSEGTDPNLEALVTIDKGYPSASVDTLPEISPSRFTVSWDAESPSGMRSYDVYVRPVGGSWSPWLAGYSGSSATFIGDPYTDYEFYALGTNNVGVTDEYMPIVQAYTTAGVDSVDLYPVHTPDQKVELSWIAYFGFSYQLQSSADQLSWTNVGPVQTTSNATELIIYKDEDYSMANNKFYRLLITSP
ncbi:MAG: right-handed parallel beta-helix repeat-containing protein [Puniceicoccaceae bacterium]